MSFLGDVLRLSRPEEALPVLEALLALFRRYWSRSETNILAAQAKIAMCLGDLGRRDDKLALERENYARYVAIQGVSHEHTITSGANLALSMGKLGLCDEAVVIARPSAARCVTRA